jgi:hypothetical protein
MKVDSLNSIVTWLVIIGILVWVVFSSVYDLHDGQNQFVGDKIVFENDGSIHSQTGFVQGDTIYILDGSIKSPSFTDGFCTITNGRISFVEKQNKFHTPTILENGKFSTGQIEAANLIISETCTVHDILTFQPLSSPTPGQVLGAADTNGTVKWMTLTNTLGESTTSVQTSTVSTVHGALCTFADMSGRLIDTGKDVNPPIFHDSDSSFSNVSLLHMPSYSFGEFTDTDGSFVGIKQGSTPMLKFLGPNQTVSTTVSPIKIKIGLDTLTTPVWGGMVVQSSTDASSRLSNVTVAPLFQSDFDSRLHVPANTLVIPGDAWDVEVSGVIPINTSTVKGQLLLYVSTTTTNFLLHLCEPDTFVPSNTVEQHFTARIKLMVTETNSLFASVTTFLSLSSGQTTFYMSQDTAMTNLDTEILSVELLLKTDTAFSSTGMVEQKCFTSRLNFNV